MRLPFAVRVFITLVRQAIKEFGEDRGSLMAAAISYYVLFSLFPLLLFLISMASFFLDEEEAKAQAVDAVLRWVPLSPNEGANTIRQVIDSVIAARGVLSIVSLIGVIWSASSMFGILRTALNVAWDVERKRPPVQQKLIDLGMVIGAGALFLLSLGSTAFLQIVRRLSEAAPGLLSDATGPLWSVAFYLLPAVFSFIAFALVFHFLPSTPTRWREALVGALVTTVMFELGKDAFAVYLRNFGNYQTTYGALGGLFAFLFWAYLSANFVLLGAEVASELPRVLRGDYWGEEAKPPTEAERLPWQQKALRLVKGLFVHHDGGQPAS